MVGKIQEKNASKKNEFLFTAEQEAVKAIEPLKYHDR